MTDRSFAQALREARTAAGLSQSGLARRAGLTPSYLSLLESKKKRPPTPRVVTALCRALGIDEAPFQEAAALERTPAPIRRRLLRIDRERGTVARARDRILSTTLFHIAQNPIVWEPLADQLGLSGGERSLLTRLLGKAKKVSTPVDAEAKSEQILEETDTRERDRLMRVLPRVISGGAPLPPAGSEAAAAAGVVPVPLREDLEAESTSEELPLPSSIASPDAFLWRATTDDGWPRVEPGDLLVVEPARTPEVGDLVVFRDDGVVRIRSLTVVGEEVRLLAARPDVPPVRRRVGRFLSVGVVAWVLRETRAR